MGKKKIKGGRCWERVFGPGRRTADAEVVVIMLGLADVVRGEAGLTLQALGRDMGVKYPEGELAEVVRNVREVARRLREEGKKVLIVDLPSNGAVVTGYGEGKMKRLNRQLRQVCKDDLSKLRGSEEGENSNPVTCIQLGSNYKILNQDNRAFDSLHFNRKGYRLLAEDIWESLRPMLVNVEWQTWKVKLAKGGGLEEHEFAMKGEAENVAADIKKRYEQGLSADSKKLQ